MLLEKIKQLCWSESFQNHEVHVTNARYTYTCQAYLILNALKWLPKLLLSLPPYMLWSHHYGIFLPLILKAHPIHTHMLCQVSAPTFSPVILGIPTCATFIDFPFPILLLLFPVISLLLSTGSNLTAFMKWPNALALNICSNCRMFVHCSCYCFCLERSIFRSPRDCLIIGSQLNFPSCRLEWPS